VFIDQKTAKQRRGGPGTPWARGRVDINRDGRVNIRQKKLKFAEIANT